MIFKDIESLGWLKYIISLVILAILGGLVTIGITRMPDKDSYNVYSFMVSLGITGILVWLILFTIYWIGFCFSGKKITRIPI